jgi:hypothetical protein
MKCSVFDCETEAINSGMCGRHYAQKYRETHPEWVIKNRERAKEVYEVYCLSSKARYNQLLSSARRRGRKVFLSFEEFSVLRNQPCHYCGGELPKAGSGMDRKDNSLEYTFENTVPCCYQCNTTKGSNLSYHEMLTLMAFRNESNLAELMVSSC